MDTMIQGGDHAVDGRGLPVSVHGTEELIQRALIRLSVPKGRFAPDLSLGSGLHELPGVKTATRDRVAMGYVQEALYPLREVQVERVACTTEAEGVLAVRVVLVIAGNSYTLEVGVA